MRLTLDHLEHTAAAYPDRTAFIDDDTSITYSDLVEYARRAGSALLKIKGDRRVAAFYMDKRVEAICGFMGSAYAHMTYMLINRTFPVTRVNDILHTLEPCLVITDREHLEDWKKLGADHGEEPVLIEELLSAEIDDERLSAARSGIIDTDPLYISFTSGSTGKPKGVTVCHRSIVDFVTAFIDVMHITKDDVMANQAPFDYDASIKDIYSAIFTGATVRIVPTSRFLRPTELMDTICDCGATVMIWAVSALCFVTQMNALTYRVPDRLRLIAFSGEVMPIKQLNRLRKYLPNVTYVNLYGPTESTCNCTYYIVDREYDLSESLPIGRPFPNERIILLDENNREVMETGRLAELCIAGTTLALGYYNDPERTSETFVRNPLNTVCPETIYRTGDLVSIEEDGNIYFRSRKDFQIKHMGHRIELSEIEVRMNAVDGVDRSCCLYDNARDRIYAYYTGTCEPDTIRKHIAETLPPYMLPNAYRHIEEFPINKNGKIDRAQLRQLGGQE